MREIIRALSILSLGCLLGFMAGYVTRPMIMRDAGWTDVDEFDNLHDVDLSKRSLMRMKYIWNVASGKTCGTLRHKPKLLRPSNGELLKNYGAGFHPLLGRQAFHRGVDFVGAGNTPVSAAATGWVVYAERLGSYGNYVKISHSEFLSTGYAHLWNIHVRYGDCVNEGDLLGTVGSTGMASEPHLHFEVRVNDVTVDPLAYVQ